MAISLKTAGTWARLVVDGTVAIPGSPAAGDRMFLFCTWKAFSITVTDPTNWTPIGTEFADGAVGSGSGLGSVKVMAWYRDWQSGDAAPTIDWSANPTEGHAVIMLWTKANGETWSTPQTVTAAIAAADPFTATASATVDIPDRSVVMCLIGLRDDSTTIARSTTTAIEDDGTPDVTWNGNYVESPATHFTSTTGEDMSGDLGHRFVTTGAAGVSLTTTGDPAAAETGAAKWVVQSVTSVFNFVQSADNSSDSDLTITMTVSAGSLIVAWAKWEGASGGTGIVSLSDGTDTFELRPLRNNGTDMHAQAAYLLNSSAGAKTYTIDINGTEAFVDWSVAEFTYTGTAAFDAQAGATGNSGTCSSGNVVLGASDDGLVIGCFAIFDAANTWSARNINNLAASNFFDGRTAYTTFCWDFINSGTIDADATNSAVDLWVAEIIGFKAAAGGGGGGAVTPRHMLLLGVGA